MNKRNKLIFVCIIEVAIILFIIFLFLKFNIYVLKITDLYENTNSNNNIIISAISDDNTLYNFSCPNLILKNLFKKVDYSTLSENDVILVLSSPPNIIPDIANYNIYGQQVKKIYGTNIVIILKDN